MKELLKKIVHSLNIDPQKYGYYKYVQQVAQPIDLKLDATPLTTIRCMVIRDDTQEIIFIKSMQCNTVISNLDEAILRVQEELLSDIIKHSIFGLEGRFLQMKKEKLAVY